MRLLAIAFTLVLLGFASRPTQAQAPGWENIHPLEVPGYVVATVSANGSVYVAGTVVHWTSGADDPENGPSKEGQNAFVAKWDATTHRLVWLVEMGNQFQDNDEATGLVVHDSSVYVLGEFSKKSQGFGHPVAATGSGDAFVTKLTDHGASATANWTQPLGYPASSTLARHLACDGSAIYVAGTTENLSDRADPVTHQWLPHVVRAFVAKLTDAGTQGVAGWQRTWEVSRDYHVVVALAAQRGRVYVATNTWQDTPYPTEPPAEVGQGTLPRHADYRLHLTQLRDEGVSYHLDWTHTEPGQGTGLAVAGSALYVVGHADADQPFGEPRPLIDAHEVPGDLFVAKLVVADTTVHPAWVQRLRGTGHDEYARLWYVAVRGERVYVAGTFSTFSLALGPTVLPNAEPQSRGIRNLFVAQLTDTGAAGRIDWAQRLGSEYAAELWACALDGPRLYLSGHFQGYHGEPVLLGAQQFMLSHDRGVQLQAWLPVGE